MVIMSNPSLVSSSLIYDGSEFQPSHALNPTHGALM